MTGEAEVPRPVTVRVPEQGARIEVRTWYDSDNPAPAHPLAWTATGPDRAVRLRLEANADDGANETSTCRRAWALQDLENGGLQEPQLFRIPEPGPSDAVMVRAIDLTGRDSVDIRGWYLYCDDPPTGELDGALQLAVFHLAYAQYLDELARSQSLSLAEASVGLRGAVGVFTGTAVTRQPVRLIVRTEQQHEWFERSWR